MQFWCQTVPFVVQNPGGKRGRIFKILHFTIQLELYLIMRSFYFYLYIIFKCKLCAVDIMMKFQYWQNNFLLLFWNIIELHRERKESQVFKFIGTFSFNYVKV